MGTVVGAAELERLIEETAATHPETVNPRATDGGCLYRGGDGVLCLLGSVLVHKLGFEYDATWEGREPLQLFQDLGFGKDAAAVAYRWQDNPDKPALRWGALPA